jgi:dTDP-4-dehydrorhamnose reductase
MSAAGQATWYDFAQVILKEAEAAPRDLVWLADATKGRQLIARCVIPISTEESHSPTHRPSYSVLSNSRLIQVFGTALPDWQSQLQRCFASDCSAANIAAGGGVN